MSKKQSTKVEDSSEQKNWEADGKFLFDIFKIMKGIASEDMEFLEKFNGSYFDEKAYNTNGETYFFTIDKNYQLELFKNGSTDYVRIYTFNKDVVPTGVFYPRIEFLFDTRDKPFVRTRDWRTIKYAIYKTDEYPDINSAIKKFKEYINRIFSSKKIKDMVKNEDEV